MSSQLSDKTKQEPQPPHSELVVEDAPSKDNGAEMLRLKGVEVKDGEGLLRPVSPKTIEFPEEFTDKERECLEKMKLKLAKIYPAYTATSNHKLMRFVRARKLDPEAAADQYVATMKWRQQWNVDSWRVDPPDNYRKLVPEAFHGFDKQGHPSYIVRAGKIDPNYVQQCTIRDFIEVHIWGMEYSYDRAEQQSIKLGRWVDKFTNIVDMAGLAMKHRHAMRYVAAMAKIDAQYYPEALNRTFIVNPPLAFTVIWNSFKRFVDPVTVSKVIVLGKDYKKELLEWYDPSQLPEEYGGSCRCPGGCVPVYTPQEMQAALDEEQAKMHLHHEVVKAGGKCVQEVKVGKFGGVLSFFFKTKANDIKFGVTFVPEGGEHKAKELVKSDKVKSHVTPQKDSCEVGEAGTFHLVWDNSYSIWKDKHLSWATQLDEYNEAHILTHVDHTDLHQGFDDAHDADEEKH